MELNVSKMRKNYGEFACRRNRLVGEGVVSYGVRTSEIRRIVSEYWKRYSELKLEENCLKTARELMLTKVLDDQMAGIFLLELHFKSFKLGDISKLKKLLLAI